MKIANELDNYGLKKEADVVDRMMVKGAAGDYPMSEFDPKGVEQGFWDEEGKGVPEQYRHKPGDTTSAYDPVRDKDNPLFYSGYEKGVYEPFDAMKDEMRSRGVNPDVKYWKPEYSRYYSGGKYNVPEAYLPDEYDDDPRDKQYEDPGTSEEFKDKYPGRGWTEGELSSSKYTPTSLAGQSSGVRSGPSEWDLMNNPRAASFFEGPGGSPYAVRSEIEDKMIKDERAGKIKLPSSMEYLHSGAKTVTQPTGTYEDVDTAEKYPGSTSEPVSTGGKFTSEQFRQLLKGLGTISDQNIDIIIDKYKKQFESK